MDKIIPKSTDKKVKLLQYIEVLNGEIENLEYERFKANSRAKQEADKAFRLDKKNKKLNDEMKEKDEEIRKLKNELAVLKSKPSEVKIKNERSAGRKSIITDELIHSVESFRKAGFTQKSIANTLGVSVATVNKILNS